MGSFKILASWFMSRCCNHLETCLSMAKLLCRLYVETFIVCAIVLITFRNGLTETAVFGSLVTASCD